MINAPQDLALNMNWQGSIDPDHKDNYCINVTLSLMRLLH